MNPKVVAVSGPLEGTHFDLEGKPFSIGRHSSNRAQISEISVSRKHCLIRPSENGWEVVDQDSRHGTFVNGLAVKQSGLKHGDLISVGGSTFLVLTEASAADEPDLDAVWLRDTAYTAASTLTVPVQELLSQHSRRVLESTQESGGTAALLNALLEASRTVNAARDADELGCKVLEQALKVTPAERTAFLTLDRAGKSFQSMQALNRSGAEEPFAISQTIAFDTVKGKASILCSDVVEERPSDSLESSGIQTLACVPLLRERALGVLYADSSHPEHRFARRHLRMLTALADIAAAALENVLRLEWLELERRRLQAAEMEHGMVGETPAMQKVYSLVARVAPTDSTILIRGESGTGKDLAARAIHAASSRADQPFVAINCATLSETLIESELFGHQKGAFTGAITRKAGKLEVADSGTVFLDEVGELPTSVQAKLLRVIESREFERVGGTRPIHVDVRIIAATNRDLEKAVQEGEFRNDLYYRLNVISFAMPALRDRRQDIPLLASHFLSRYAKKLKKPLAGFSPQARSSMLGYEWPGNVRELANAVERAAVLAESDLIRPEDLPETVLETAIADEGSATKYHDSINQLKRRLVIEAVDQSGGSITKAAELLGLHPNYLHKLIRNLGLRSELKRR